MDFTAINFKTATGNRNRACDIGIVTVKNGIIVDIYSALIQPPDNKYLWSNINIHGTRSDDTRNINFFPDIYPMIRKRLQGKKIVAHNESFDRSVLYHTMKLYDLDYAELNLPDRWECTCKIYRKKGFNPANLAACCKRMNIYLNHHDAVSDAIACAMLYMK